MLWLLLSLNILSKKCWASDSSQFLPTLWDKILLIFIQNMLCNMLVEMLLNWSFGGMPSPTGAMTWPIKAWSRSSWVGAALTLGKQASQPASPNIVLCPKAFLLDTECGQTNKIGALLQIVRLRAWYQTKISQQVASFEEAQSIQSKERLSCSKGTLKKLQN